MALPVLSTPKFELTLPSSKKKYKFRPFLAKEEKILLIAMQSEDQTQITDAIKDIVSSCVEGLDAESIAMFDLEYIFLKLREKSIGESITFYARHKDNINAKGEECKHVQEVKLNLSQVKVDFPKDHTNKIQLDDKIGIVMKYPTIELAEKFEGMNENDADAAFNMIKESIDFIYDAENTYSLNDYSKSEVDEFIDSMSHVQLEKIQNFFETMPKLSHEIKWKCSECGEEESVIVEGIANFFI